ncbi:TIGR03943 family putative permease subunit [Tepidiforma sp.]|uniref:TIGR03943 family putative permease subunit n=1 Tax=Tepidiforma sp. TaxID=2682230 RepID=UPI002ADD8479|nr:TIGR03943 family protein [Tepidiforma sp.]
MVRQAGHAVGALALGLLLAWRLADGSARNLVQGWYVPVLAVTAAALVVLAAWAAVPALRRRERTSLPGPGGLFAAALVALPVIVGAATVPQALGSGRLDPAGTGARQFGAAASAADPAARNVYQWAYEFETAEPAAIVGQPVDVIGFVYRAQDEPAGQFQVARFVVACCIADAQGFTLPVAWKDAASLANDQWVRVSGRVGIGPGGEPVVLASSVEPIEVPKNPYIYP